MKTTSEAFARGKADVADRVLAYIRTLQYGPRCARPLNAKDALERVERFVSQVFADACDEAASIAAANNA